MLYKIEIKQFFGFFKVLMAIVLLFGSAEVGFARYAKANLLVDADNPDDDIPLTSGWIQTNWEESNSYFTLYGSNNKVFARIWDSFNGGRMFLSTNDGMNWTQIDTADNSIDILSIVELDSKILAGTWSGFIQSTDDGATWNALTPIGIPEDTEIWSIMMFNDTLFAVSTGDVYKSSDNGDTWTEISSGIKSTARMTPIVATGDAIFAGTANYGVIKLANNETRWKRVNDNLTDLHISQLVVLDNKLFAVTSTGVFESDDNGDNWGACLSAPDNVNCIIAVNEQLIAGTDGGGAYLSVDKGENWSSLNLGLPDSTRIWSLAVSNDSIFAGTSSGIWVTGSSTLVNVEREILLAETISLKQNYPNPFNMSTNISFSIPSKSFVSLKIYDQLGREVETIFSEEVPAGNYTQKWNAANAPSGIYFYRLEAGLFSETKKLILLP